MIHGLTRGSMIKIGLHSIPAKFGSATLFISALFDGIILALVWVWGVALEK